jgi:predicted esterase
MRRAGAILTIVGLLCLGLVALTDAQSRPRAAEDPLDNARSEARTKVIAMLLEELPAEAYVVAADGLKAEGRYDEAAVYYLVALKMNPKFRQASYQLGCNFALWRQEKLAMRFLKNAVDAGFWGWETMSEDQDLESIRKDPAFAALAKVVRERYEKEAPRHAGGTLLKVPVGQPPKGGWPVLVLLHGWGSNKEDMAEVAELATKHGLAGLIVSGPVVLNEGAYRWPTERLDDTHEHLKTILTGLESNEALDTKRVYLSGFSQGALHSALLVAGHPETYAGALAISPGGTFRPPYELKAPEATGKIFLVGGRAEPVTNKTMLEELRRTFEMAKRPVRVHWHEGGHNLPGDWKTRFAEAFDWLTAP